MQYLLFLLAHPAGTFISAAAPSFSKKFIQTGRERNFVDKAAPFAQLFVNPAIVEATLLIG